MLFASLSLSSIFLPGEIGALEATRISNESTLQDLRSSLAKLEDKLQWMEKERENLESSKRSLSDQKHSQLKSLEQVLTTYYSKFLMTALQC